MSQVSASWRRWRLRPQDQPGLKPQVPDLQRDTEDRRWPNATLWPGCEANLIPIRLAYMYFNSSVESSFQPLPCVPFGSCEQSEC